MERKNNAVMYIERISLFLLGVVLFAFPLVFSPSTTDQFVIPKQILLGIGGLSSLILLGVKMLYDKTIKLRKTPFDIPLVIFLVATIISTYFSVNWYDSLIALIPLLFAICVYFGITSSAKNESSVSFLVYALIAGATVLSIMSSLSFFKISVLPFEFAKIQNFTPLGALLEQALYLSIVLPVAIYFAWPLVTIKNIKHLRIQNGIFAAVSIILAVGLAVTVYQLLFTEKPTLMPYEIGFRIAFAAISQDPTRTIPAFLFGSGFGTFMTDFTRFKPVSLNTDPALWQFTFFRSSSLILELLATIGAFGLATFVFVLTKFSSYIKKGWKTLKNPFAISLVLIIFLSFLLPFASNTMMLIFFVLALFVAVEGLYNSDDFYDIELRFLAFKRGFIPISVAPASSHEKSRSFHSFPVIVAVVLFLLAGAIGYYSVRFALSDVTFQSSIEAAKRNDAQKMYDMQKESLNTFPYRDSYHRIFAQNNLSIANSLASQQPKDSSPSARIQQTIYTLIQQSINSGRNATTVAPYTTTNWQNLSSIYKSLIGFGSNAEGFAVASAQQAIALDPNNPQQYLNLGGIYFQLRQWDLAERQFNAAISLKPDFANGYYNLGHAMEASGNVKGALVAYERVRELTSNDKKSLETIEKEIKELEEKIGEASKPATPSAESKTVSPTQPEDLRIATPSAQFPRQNPQVELPPPPNLATQSAQ